MATPQLPDRPALRVIPLHWETEVNSVSKKIAKVGHKNEDISESMNSFDLGVIFLRSLGHKTSRNAFVVSILSPGRISYVGTGFFMTPKSRKSHENRSFSKGPMRLP